MNELNDAIDIPIHSHSKKGSDIGRTVFIKTGPYDQAEVCRVSVPGAFFDTNRATMKRAEDLEIELANVICEYLEGKRDQGK